MAETQWDIQEVKRWKKKQLVQYNVAMLLLFVLICFFIEYGKPYFFIGVFYMIVLTVAASVLYNLSTGRFIGTKTSRRVQEFDKARLGEKRWKRRKILEAVLIIVLTVCITIFIFTTDFNNSTLRFSSAAFPFIGAWLGYNIGEIVRMNNLKEQLEQ